LTTLTTLTTSTTISSTGLWWLSAFDDLSEEKTIQSMIRSSLGAGSSPGTTSIEAGNEAPESHTLRGAGPNPGRVNQYNTTGAVTTPAAMLRSPHAQNMDQAFSDDIHIPNLKNESGSAEVESKASDADSDIRVAVGNASINQHCSPNIRAQEINRKGSNFGIFQDEMQQQTQFEKDRTTNGIETFHSGTRTKGLSLSLSNANASLNGGGGALSIPNIKVNSSEQVLPAKKLLSPQHIETNKDDSEKDVPSKVTGTLHEISATQSKSKEGPSLSQISVTTQGTATLSEDTSLPTKHQSILESAANSAKEQNGDQEAKYQEPIEAAQSHLHQSSQPELQFHHRNHSHKKKNRK